MSTTVDEIRNVVLLLSNPSWARPAATTVINITAFSSEITYSTRTRGNITVLSSRNAPSANGLLYVPDLPATDPCVKQSAPFLPDSVVRRSNLPPTNYNLVAIAPWISSTCSKKYMDAASSAPIRALIFYRPSNSSATPPAATSAVWDINGSTRWRAQASYLVFAVPGLVGQDMMRQLSLYSGNVTEVPFAQNISKIYSPGANDYVRIWTDMDVSTPSTLFGIWVYFLIVVAVLVFIISATSLTMHLAQAGRRMSLRRRVISGEVNLEGMGIKKLTVPMLAIQRFPLYTYRYEPPRTSSPISPKFSRGSHSHDDEETQHDQALPEGSRQEPASPRGAMASETPLANPVVSSSIATDSQPLCAICLQRFQNRITVIREIGCGHIFHPECIDEFLSEVSSLCPICKANMLPKGYCPKITNETVRRELAIRRLRHSGRSGSDAGCNTRKDLMCGLGSAVKNRVFGSNATQAPTIKTKTSKPKRVLKDVQPMRSGQAPDSVTRERMRALAGSPLEDRPGTPITRWKRIKNRIFPGY
ncbi:hypothetical protein B0T16DRAFT_400972 [Cercophora newfieldiana]|uniref:RING-type domain-containing protein n=1 Tax=Cercophora newfieldiana TaxID=92897 RepID=A0AA39YS53_9PEZI|nr:hypothetical protein B0T16DRAFT_400972 [Cercophora newfieldiana]